MLTASLYTLSLSGSVDSLQAVTSKQNQRERESTITNYYVVCTD